MRLALRVALMLVGMLLLVGCASLSGYAPQGPADESAWQARMMRLAALASWELSGSVGLINGKDGGSGSLDWKQTGAELSFDFRGPLGTGAVHIQGDAAMLHVQTSRGDDFTTTDPEEDFAEHLHMPMPVSSMRYWMLGIPDPGASYTKIADAQGEPMSLVQRDWQVEYQEYADVAGETLPIHFTLTRGNVRIKVVVSQWTLPPTVSTAAP